MIGCGDQRRSPHSRRLELSSGNRDSGVGDHDRPGRSQGCCLRTRAGRRACLGTSLRSPYVVRCCRCRSPERRTKRCVLHRMKGLPLDDDQNVRSLAGHSVVARSTWSRVCRRERRYESADCGGLRSSGVQRESVGSCPLLDQVVPRTPEGPLRVRRRSDLAALGQDPPAAKPAD